mmetsp:Transcript_24094/g.45835  ORF Transcript_24094/g.45835 Transcript_24094/m.45835 type:complete len:231 (-) Transcript_24094:367-1059(-)
MFSAFSSAVPSSSRGTRSSSSLSRSSPASWRKVGSATDWASAGSWNACISVFSTYLHGRDEGGVGDLPTRAKPSANTAPDLAVSSATRRSASATKSARAACELRSEAASASSAQHSFMPSTLATSSWELICSRAWFQPLATTSYGRAPSPWPPCWPAAVYDRWPCIMGVGAAMADDRQESCKPSGTSRCGVRAGLGAGGLCRPWSACAWVLASEARTADNGGEEEEGTPA